MDYILTIPMHEMVKWGENQNDDDDFHPNPDLQIVANYLKIDFPICYLYLLYYDGFFGINDKVYRYRSQELGNHSLIVMDLSLNDPTDQNDFVRLGVRCSSKYDKKVKKHLTRVADALGLSAGKYGIIETEKSELLD